MWGFGMLAVSVSHAMQNVGFESRSVLNAKTCVNKTTDLAIERNKDYEH